MNNPGRVLVRYGKHGETRFFARTPEEELDAYLAHFKKMDEQDFYYDLEEDLLRWYDEARSGHAESARRVLDIRCDWEYEQIEFEYIEIPPPRDLNASTN